jgi:hypothetical protein
MTQPPPRIGLIVNPAAGRARHTLVRRPFWRGRLPESHVRVTEDLAALDQAVAELRAQDLRLLACLGGDGTLHHLVNALARQAWRVPILPLGGGTLNGLSHAFCVPEAERAFARALTLDTFPRRRQPTLRLEGDPPRLGFTLAAGLAVPAAEAYAARDRQGAAAFLRVVLEAATGRFGDATLRLCVDGGPEETARLVVAGTVQQPFLFVRPYGMRTPPPVGFLVTRVAMTSAQMLPRAWSILRGKARHPGVTISTAGDLAIQTDGGVVIDGESVRPGEPGPIRLKAESSVEIVDFEGI